MANLIIYFVIAIVILLIVAINMLLNPKTKKKGLVIVSTILFLVATRYFYCNYTFIGYKFFESFDSPISILNDLIENIIVMSLLLSPIAFFLGIIIAIFAKEKKQLATKIVIFSIIIFIIACGTCLNTNYVHPFGNN